MNKIGHDLLDQYVAVKGELEKLPDPKAVDPELWEILDQLFLDLHMIRHGYVSEGYSRFVDRRLQEVCAGENVVVRLKEIRF